MLTVKHLPKHNKQDGAVLIFSIILLLVMTLLGLSTLNTSNIQEKVSSNSQEYNEVFQAAESAVAAQVSAAIARTNATQLFASEALNGAQLALVAPVGFDPTITTTVSVRFEGIPATVDGQPLDADSNSTNIAARKYAFDATSSKGTADNQISTTISQGIDYN